MNLRDSKFGKIISIFLGLSFFIGEGLNYSQLGPFFPTEAQNKKDVSVSLVGFITGAFDMANLIAAFALAAVITPKNQKFFFCTGAIISSSSNGLFGLMGWSVGGTPYIVVCILIRIVMGTGASMVLSTGVPLLVPIYPKWAGKITSLIETSVGLGLMIGPSLGSAFYSLGGYPLPFLVSAGIELTFAVFCIIFLPTANEHMQKQKRDPDTPTPSTSEYLEATDDPGFNFIYYVTRPELILVSLPLIFTASSFGYLDVALGPYLEDKFGIGGDTSGYYFLAFSIVYGGFSPILGLLVDKGHAGRIFVACAWAGGIGFTMMWLPDLIPPLESEYWLIIWLAVEGVASSGGFVPSYLLFEKLAYKVGFKNENNVKLITAAWINVCFAGGRIVGPIIIGGVFKEKFGYYNGCLFQGSLILFSTLFCNVVCQRCGFLGPIYYPTTETVPFAKYDADNDTMVITGFKLPTESLSAERDPELFIGRSGRFNPVVSMRQSQKLT